MSKTLRILFLGIILFLLCGPLVIVSGVSLNAKKRLFSRRMACPCAGTRNC